MTTRESQTIFAYLLDKITRRSLADVDDSLPQELQDDLQFAMWMNDIDFSQDSTIQASLRNKLEKQAELLQNASRLKHPQQAKQTPRKISLAALIGIIVGGLSMLTAALLVIFRKRKGQNGAKLTS
ncbi:MAG: hypothetical protein HPY85_12150 [Anaerolineae bacterium]|nr:hypothetical protein [Anaerolineae bacterium]